MKIFAVYCPNCETETPISTKNKDKLNEMEINCLNCEWMGMANEAIVKERSFEDWF